MMKALCRHDLPLIGGEIQTISQYLDPRNWFVFICGRAATAPSPVGPVRCYRVSVSVSPRLLALSDLHVAFPENRKIIDELRPGV